MYFMFCLVVIIFVVDSITVKHQFKDHHPFTIDNNTLKSNGKSLDKFMLIPSIGYESNNEPDMFTIIVNGWYYEPLNPSLLQNIIQLSLHAALDLFDSSTALSKQEREERLGPFFVRDIKQHKIQIKLSNSISQIVTTDDNGRFHEKIIIKLSDELTIKGNVLKYITSDDDYHEQGNEGFIYLMNKKSKIGCSIISDIDDTIKISEVPDKKKLAINTFKKDFKAVPGMSDVYQLWQSSHKCLIHYVSAMPSQLYYITQKFLTKEKFPGGSFHMRHLKLVGPDKYDLIKKILDFAKQDASQKHKLRVIQDILDHAPVTQQFTMVGDSGELDPEIYGEIARKYPDRIKMIFIRHVEGGKNDDNRFQVAFNDIPNDKWKVFNKANELPHKLYDDNDIDDAPINPNNDLDDEINVISLSTSLFYNIYSVLFISYFTMTYN
ncbi:unnamed protein product [Adineta steineri]|uniref:Phosphatidate phosphatase APP1 catalytic domain-containing protein n=1 Tax=Adineta steineri TaxID=433720 RepID=A0A819SVV2_9BILA|nr:unnamed protein product [Adineta steineri]